MKILVVEDDLDSRVLLEAALGGRGYVVESAANGARALELARVEPPDLIISDILMPEMDGFALCRAVKADEGLRRVPFVFYTATFVDPRDEQLALALGASRFLVKPMEPVEFLRVIDTVLREHRERRLSVPEGSLESAERLEAMHSARLAAKLETKVRDLERERRALSQAEEWLRSVLRAAPGAILCLSPEGSVVELNAEAERMLGIEGRAALDGGGWDDAFRRALGGESIRGWEAQFAGPSGQERILAWNLERITDPAGTSAGIVAVGRDVTEARHVEEARRRSEERLDLALRGAELGVWDWDLRTGEVAHNDRWCEMLGDATDEVRSGEPWEGRVHPEDRAAVLAAMDAHLAGRAPLFEMEHRLQTRSGEWRWVLARARVVERDGNGEPVRVAGTHLDITERKRIEGEREALEEQLSKVQHLESLGRLAGGIAHDFNNLLTPIVACAEMIMMRPDAASLVGSRARQILDAAHRAGDLTRQFLAISRKQVLEMKRLDLNDVVEGFHKLLRQLVREDIEIQLRLAPPPLSRVLADRSQIEQIIMNLAINAADAMPRGGRIAIETSSTVLDEGYAAAHAGARPGPYVLLRVSDTGSGMTPEVLEHVFEPFFTTKERGKGTGLGLSTVYGVVSQHGGTIDVESEPGAGTTFRIFLPRVEGAADIEATPTPGPEVAGGAETVLIVEDQEMVRELAREVLTGLGYRVLDAADAQGALAAAEGLGGPIHLLISDVILPGMNGVDLARQLTAARPGLKVLLMSGYADEVISAQGVMGRGTPFLQKPFTVRSLTAKVREVLDAPDPTPGAR